MMTFNDAQKGAVCVVGLGYVGLPLAAAFSRVREVVAFDVDANRIAELREGVDKTNEIDFSVDVDLVNITFTANEQDVGDCHIYIVTVPTPVDNANRPDLSAVEAATKMIGRHLHPHDIVIYESTVFPGVTEEFCAPILQDVSGLAYAGTEVGQDDGVFHLGYSPERINPGDPDRRIGDIVKVTSGSSAQVADLVDQLYGSIITAGTHKAQSIKVAEAAKVIENIQRDVNIALVNELAILFGRLDIDTEDVLVAAGTKWNFIPFRPGLVGGHCIGVDPYYLTHKATLVGYTPEMILAGRRINESMSGEVATRIIMLMLQRGIDVSKARVLVMGLTFKENCPDMRNSKVIDLISHLTTHQCAVDAYDPLVEVGFDLADPNVKIIESPKPGEYDAVVLAVSHNAFFELGLDGIKNFCKPNHVLFDIKCMFPASEVDGRL